MYAIVKTGGKQYRVEEGQSLLVERLPGDDGAKVPLQPLLYVDGSTVLDGDQLAKVSVEARVVGHERGPAGWRRAGGPAGFRPGTGRGAAADHQRHE